MTNQFYSRLQVLRKCVKIRQDKANPILIVIYKYPKMLILLPHCISPHSKVKVDFE